MGCCELKPAPLHSKYVCFVDNICTNHLCFVNKPAVEEFVIGVSRNDLLQKTNNLIHHGYSLYVHSVKLFPTSWTKGCRNKIITVIVVLSLTLCQFHQSS